MMRQGGVRALLVVGFAAAAHPARAQKPFEGIIDARIDTPMGSATASYSIKGDKLRMDMSMANGMASAMIVDAGAHRTYMLMATRHMYIERDLPDSMPVAARRSAADDVTWTGRTEKIAGLSCEHALLTEADGSRVDMCIAKGITYVGGGMGGPTPWQRHALGGFPLKVQREEEPTPMFLVTKVQRKALGDDRFAPPPGWQRMTMPMGVPLGRP